MNKQEGQTITGATDKELARDAESFKRNANLFSLNPPSGGKGDDPDQIASAAFLASLGESDARLSGGDKNQKLPSRPYGSTHSDPIYSSLTAGAASAPVIKEKELDTIEKVEPSSLE